MSSVAYSLGNAAHILALWTDWVLTKGIDALIWALAQAQIWVLKKKKEIFEAIALWLDAGWRGLKMLVIIYVAGAIVVGIEMIRYLAAWKVKLSGFLAALQTIDTITRVKLSVAALKVAWKIVTELDERFAELEKSFFQFCQAFDESFGYPLGFLASVAASYRVYLKALYAAAGFPDADARVDWFTNIADALKKADEAFESYALNPGKFLGLLEGLAVLASNEDVSKLNRATLDTVATLVNTTDTLAGSIDDVEKAMQGIVRSFPDEIKKVLDRQIGPFFTFWDEKVTPVLERIEGILDEMRPEIERLIRLASEPLQLQLDTLLPWVSAMYRFLGYELTDPDVRAQYLNELFSEGIVGGDARLAADAIVFDVVHDMLRVEYHSEPPPVKGSTAIFEPGLFLPPETAGSPRWYVGEDESGSKAKPPWYTGG